MNTIDELDSGCSDIEELVELAVEEADQETFQEVEAEVSELDAKIEKLEFRRMFSGDHDAANCYLDIQSGSGGTEAQDWASMLMRMYLRWGEAHGYKTELIEVTDGDVAGIKGCTIKYSGEYAYGWLRTETGVHRLVRKSPFDSASRRHTSFASAFIYPEVDDGDVAGIKGCTIKYSGEYAYGWLRTETGVHRLVRKSPFDSASRRHTSFASAFIYPEVDDNIEIEINPADLRVDTYRASGAGGQHVNKTDSAIRLTHIPTGAVVQCQNDRSQHKNRSQAMKLLKAKLFELEMQKQNEDKQVLEDGKSDIGWGSQIRSYVLDDSRIKDLRTGVENRNTQAVLDGDLDRFLEASLKSGL